METLHPVHVLFVKAVENLALCIFSKWQLYILVKALSGLLLALLIALLLIAAPVMAQRNCDYPFGELRSDRAYPDICIALPPPDLDCKDISVRNFRVFSSDPHRFDRDGDGIGCESR